jgi:hypothetical protein
VVTLSDREAAIGLIDYRLIDVLRSWMIHEKRNLDGYINEPQGHVDYNPYLVIDFNALQTRSNELEQIQQMLGNISAYKQGNPNITQAMSDFGFDNIPSIIWQRLYDWAAKRLEIRTKILEDAKQNPPVPLSDYSAYATFDADKYSNDLQLYTSGVAGLQIVIEYLQQQGL